MARYKSTMYQMICPAVSLLMLLGLLIYQRGLEVRADSQDEYHDRIAQALNDLPMSHGSWIGQYTEVPKAAAELLHANVVVSRSLRNIETGERVELIVVHCSDARDLLGHYPPVCYPAHGWLQRADEELNLSLGEDDHTVSRGVYPEGAGSEWPCTLYRFERMSQGYSHNMAVLNYMVLPNGQVGASMNVVDRAAADLGQRARGAMQVQVLFRDAEVEESRRIEIAEELIGHLWPVFEAVWAQ